MCCVRASASKNQYEIGDSFGWQFFAWVFFRLLIGGFHEIWIMKKGESAAHKVDDCLKWITQRSHQVGLNVECCHSRGNAKHKNPNDATLCVNLLLKVRTCVSLCVHVCICIYTCMTLKVNMSLMPILLLLLLLLLLFVVAMRTQQRSLNFVPSFEWRSWIPCKKHERASK